MTREEIIKAINDDRITIMIQPIYSVAKKKFVSAEVLARLIDENGDIIPPNEFIPIIECTKVMYKLELKILKKVCEILSKDEIIDLNLEYVEVNLSARNAEKIEFLKTAKDIVDDSGIAYNSINIEITETARPINQQLFFENINTLRDHGFRISLDDFGTGTSNFHYLVNMPIKLVKIDMSLIKDMINNGKNLSIVSGIIQMTHSLGSKTVAEGVEDEETLKALEILQADYIQGFYFSKPLHVDDFIKFIKENNKED